VGDLALLIAANYHVGRGDLAQARALLDRVRHPDATTAGLRAWMAHLDGDLPAAMGLYRQALAQDSTQATTWMGLGIAFMDLGQATEAERVMRRGLAVLPDTPNLMAMLAWSVAFQGRMDEAVALASVAARQAPDSQLGQIALGWSQFMSGDADLAAETFTDLAATSPSRRTAAMGRYGLGVVEISRGRPEAAEAAVREAVRLSPTSAEYLFFLGQIGLVRDDLPVAADAFDRLLALDRPLAYAMDAALFRAYARARLGRAPLGLDAVADTLASHPFAPLVAFAQGRATEADVLAAAATPDPALGRDWRYQAHLYLGYFAEAGIGGAPDRDRAIAHYRRAVAAYESTSEIPMAEYARRRVEGG
jgi:Flp pilus assembly protein TadD